MYEEAIGTVMDVLFYISLLWVGVVVLCLAVAMAMHTKRMASHAGGVIVFVGMDLLGVIILDLVNCQSLLRAVLGSRDRTPYDLCSFATAIRAS